MREWELAVGFVWGQWESFYVDATNEAEAHQKILEREAFNDGAVAFVTTMNFTELEDSSEV